MATQNKVRVKQHQGEFNFPEDESFQVGKIPTQRSDGKSGSSWDMYGPYKNVKRTKGYQDTLVTANQVPVTQPITPTTPPAKNEVAVMQPQNVTPAPTAPPPVSPPASSLTPQLTTQQTEAAQLVAGQNQPTDIQPAEGSEATGLTPEQMEAAKVAGKMTMVSPDAAENDPNLNKSTNPRRFVGVI